MKFKRRLCLGLLLVWAVCLPAQARVYSCVNASGEKSISDKPCTPAQTTQKVYPPPSSAIPGPVPQETEPAPVIEPLTPQTLEELEAMLRERRRAAGGLSPEEQEALARQQAEQDEIRRRGETRRQMEVYLREREQRRQEWRSGENSGDGLPDSAARNPEQQRQSECVSLLRQKENLAAVQRQGHSAASSERYNEQDRRLSAQIYQKQCTRQ